MKKNTTAGNQSPKRRKIRTQQQPLVIGMDLGDKNSRYCVLNQTGEVDAGSRWKWERIRRG